MTDTAVATTNKPLIVIMRERFESRKGELKHALPPDVSPDAFIRAFMTSAQLNPELQACTWQSLWDAALRACRDGLLPDGVEAAVVPFKSKAQYIRMYGGVLRQFRRSGQFKWLKTDVVREGETFEHWVTNAGEHFLHVPGDDFLAPIIKAYALATTKDGGEFCAVMSRAEIDKHRSYSRAQRDDAPWKVWFEAMAQKTAILKLAKVLPNARDLMGEEDDPPEIEAPPTAPQPSIPGSSPGTRAPGAAAALDTFAASSPATPSDAAPAWEGRSEQGTIDDDAANQSAAPSADRVPAAAVDDGGIAVAHERGRRWRAAKNDKQGIPPEYCHPNRTREALSWQAGFDGLPIPEWK